LPSCTFNFPLVITREEPSLRSCLARELQQLSILYCLKFSRPLEHEHTMLFSRVAC
jgi:hypothetical protein